MYYYSNVHLEGRCHITNTQGKQFISSIDEFASPPFDFLLIITLLSIFNCACDLECNTGPSELVIVKSLRKASAYSMGMGKRPKQHQASKVADGLSYKAM